MTLGRIATFAAAVSLPLVFSFAVPTTASAAQAENIHANVQQVLPVGGQTCVQPVITDVQTYVYDNALHSFSVSLNNHAYVSLAASAGDTEIPFHYMQRSTNGAGNLTVFAALPTTPLRGTVPVSMTFLASMPTGEVCMMIVSFSVDGVVLPATPAGSGTTSTTVPPVTDPLANGPVAPGGEGEGTVNGTEGPILGAPLATASAVAAAVRNVCSSASGSFVLWFVLLALYAVLVAAAAFINNTWPLVGQYMRSDSDIYIRAGIIGIPLLLLLAFWFLVPACRPPSAWMPALLFAVAIVGALVSFRDRPVISRVIQLPPSNPRTPMMTTPTPTRTPTPPTQTPPTQTPSKTPSTPPTPTKTQTPPTPPTQAPRTPNQTPPTPPKR